MRKIWTIILILLVLVGFSPWSDVAHAVDQRNVTLVRSRIRMLSAVVQEQWNYGNQSWLLSDAFVLTTAYEDVGGTYSLAISTGWIEDNISGFITSVVAGDGLTSDNHATSPTISVAVDGIDDTHIDWGTGANQVESADIPNDTTNFDGNLSGTDTTVLTALETLDELPITGGVQNYFLETTASDIGGYKLMATTYAADAARNSTATIVADATAIEEWATLSEQPGETVLLGGIYEFHFHGLKTAGTKEVTIYAELYKYETDTTETLLTTFEESGNLAGVGTEYTIHAILTEQAIDVTDRLVLKVLGNENGAGTDPQVQIDYQGTSPNETLTRLSLPASVISNPVYATISGNDPATDVTAVELETLTDTSLADALHRHAALGLDLQYEAVDTIGTSGNAAVHITAPNAGTGETWNTTFNVMNFWQQLEDDTASNVIELLLWVTGGAPSLTQYYQIMSYSDDAGTSYSIDHSFPINGPALLNSGLVVNEDSTAAGDIRWESDNEANALFGDASGDMVDANVSILMEDYYTIELQDVSLSNGDNDNVNIGTAGAIRVTGPTAVFTISGMTGGVDGRVVHVINTVAFDMTFENEEAGSTAANRILTNTGADVNTNNEGVITVIYDATRSRWIVMSQRT